MGTYRETPGYTPGPSRWRLYVQEKVNSCLSQKFHTTVEDHSWFEDGAIVECMYMGWDEPMWWKPLKRRYDKTHPNNRRTFYRTIVNIKENIKMEEFLNCKP